MLYYTYRFNPFNRYYEILEHFPELEKMQVLRKTEKEHVAISCTKIYNELAYRFNHSFSVINTRPESEPDEIIV